MQTKQIDHRPIQFVWKREKTHETVATLNRNKYQENNWTLDTSNHLQKDEKTKIKEVIRYFKAPHLTRIDIAFDFINCFSYGRMVHRIYKSNISENKHLDRAKKLTGITYGGKGSKVIYRYYDKMREQKDKKKVIPSNYKIWERLEIQLRDKKANAWLQESKIMLACFKSSNLSKLKEKNFKTYATMKVLIDDSENWQYLTKPTKAKYRKLIKKNLGLDASLSKLASKTLDKNANKLAKEINLFLSD